MRLTMIWVWIGVWVVLLLAAPLSAQEKQAIRSQQDKVSYGIGVEMANNLKRQGIEVETTRSSNPKWNGVNLDLLIKGLKDGLSGEKLLLPERELRRMLISFQSELRRNQVKTGTAVSEVTKQEGEAFLAENKIREGVVTLPSGLQYQILKQGNGRRPTEADLVEINYRGTLIDGTEFESSKPGRPESFKVKGEVIPGWTEALKLMPVGSQWRIFVPSWLAYGASGKGRQIGPNETLIFELELLAIK